MEKYKNNTLSVEERIADLISRMTLEEKARQIDQYTTADVAYEDKETCFIKTDYEKLKVMGNNPYGIVQLRNSNAKTYNEIQRYVLENTRLGIPILFCEESLHGYGKEGATVFPQQIALGCTFDPMLGEEMGAAIAREARACGIQETWNPVCDLAREPRWGRTEENFGEDTYLSSQFAYHIVKGLQGDDISRPDKVASELKHYTGYGIPIGGLNCAPAAIGKHELYEYCQPVFEAAVKEAGAYNVMCSYSSIDSQPVPSDRELLTEVLRDQWGMKGFVRSDMCAISMLNCDHNVAETKQEAIRMALEAGTDVQLYDFPHDLYQGTIIDCISRGLLSQEILDIAVGRVLRVKFDLGLFDHPYIDESIESKVFHCEEHRELAYRIASKSVTLLKNQDNLLPLKKGMKKIAVVGPTANILNFGDYSVNNRNYDKITLFHSIKEIVGEETEVVYAKGCDFQDLSIKMQDEALDAVKEADVAIVSLGDCAKTSGENLDRCDLNLPGKQLDFLKAVHATGTPVVLILQSGRPMTITWENENIPAIVQAFFSGELGGRAIAEVLFGKINPSGKLPISFPKHVGQLPVYYSRKPAGAKKYVDGIDRKPLFPFGYGLSYTTFAYSNLKLSSGEIKTDETLKVSFDITNTGTIDGEEIVQVYIKDYFASIVKPTMELKGFQRVALRSKEKKHVEIELGTLAFRTLNPKYQWVVEPGKMRVMVGRSSEDLPLQEDFMIIK